MLGDVSNLVKEGDFVLLLLFLELAKAFLQIIHLDLVEMLCLLAV